MISKLSKLVVYCAVTIVLVACTLQPIRDIDNAPIYLPSAKYDLSDVTKAIRAAGIGLGWQMREATPGHIVGRLPLRGHVAVVDITYTLDEYSIHYRDSINLNYDAGSHSIHGNYNKWTRNLSQSIDTHLITM